MQKLNKKLGYKETDVPSGTCAGYSPLNHFAYCGNKKGEINLYLTYIIWN